MSGLLRRLTRRGPATADESRSPATESSEPAAAPAETPAEPGGQTPVSVWAGQARAAEEPSPAAEEQATVVLPSTGQQPLPAWTVAATQPTAYAAQPAPPRDLPAGVDPGELSAAPASARRGKLRRRLRYLRHVRELLLRDLGGFTYEVHRTAGGAPQEPHRRLAAAKAERISKLDEEVLALESRLGEPHADGVLREPGIGGTCPHCGELHASDAHYCSRCGEPLDEKARARRAAAVAPAPAPEAVPQPASVLWAGGPRSAPEPPEEEAKPSEVTSQWLATDQPTTFARAAHPDEAAKVDEPPADVPGEVDAPATTATDDPPAEPALDEQATAVDVPDVPDEPPAKPKRVSKPRKRAPAKRKPKPQPPSFEANGRGEDVTPPVGDPVTREPGP